MLTNSKYSENSKNQILKLEDKIKQYEDKIKEIELKKNEMELLLLMKIKKKFTKVQMNEKVNSKEILKNLFALHPKLKNKTIQNIGINGRDLQLDGYNEFDDDLTHCNADF